MRANIRDGLPRLVLVSPGYNCEKYLDQWYNSLAIQNYPNWMCIAISDQSTDGMYESLIKLHELDSRIYPLATKNKQYQSKNWYDVINGFRSSFYESEIEFPNISDDDIIVFMDTDDWFGSKYVFEQIIKEYIYWDIECTTARNFQLSDYYHHDAMLYTDRKQLIDNGPIHAFSLFTYKASLFRKLGKNWFIDPVTHNWYDICGDYALTLPLLYLAGPKYHHHQFFNGEPCAIVYNDVRLECDKNKVDERGISKHELVRKRIYDHFMKYHSMLL